MGTSSLVSEKKPKTQPPPLLKVGVGQEMPDRFRIAHGYPSVDGGFYRSHLGLGSVTPLFDIPVEVLANASHFRYDDGIKPQGNLLLPFQPPQGEGLSLGAYYALYAELLLKYAARIPKKDSKWYYYRLEILRFMRASWDAVCFGLQKVRQCNLRAKRPGVLTSRHARNLRRWKVRLVLRPLRAAGEAKEAAGQAREWYYGAKRPTSPLVSCIDMKYLALNFSYCARAQPPAPKTGQGLVDLVGRLTSVPEPEHPRWREFARSYIEHFCPDGEPDWFTAPSAHAGLGYPRRTGGHEVAVGALTILGLARRPDLASEIRSKWVRRSAANARGNTFGFAEVFTEACRDAVFHIAEQVDVYPILPLEAEERGLKTRFPTCSLTAINLIQQQLRRAADFVLENDPRASKSVGGHKNLSLAGLPGAYYSADASSATDLHPQWLTEGFYEPLCERFEELHQYRKFFPKLFGTKRILVCRPSDVPDGPFSGSPNPAMPKTLADLCESIFNGTDQEDFPNWQHFAQSAFADWLGEIANLPARLSTTGQMMGDPTSFPVMSVLSAFCLYEAVGAVGYQQKKPRCRGLKAPHDQVGLFCGDDFLGALFHPALREFFDSTFHKCGGRLNRRKSFYHPTRGIFTEVPYVCGFPRPIESLSIWTAPPGGSKGEVTWVNQLQAAADHRRQFGDRERGQLMLAKKSPFWWTWQLLQEQGFPVGAPLEYGGLGAPVGVRACPTTFKWLGYLNQMPLGSWIQGHHLAAPPGMPISSLYTLRMKKYYGWLETVVGFQDKYPDRRTMSDRMLLTRSAVDGQPVTVRKRTGQKIETNYQAIWLREFAPTGAFRGIQSDFWFRNGVERERVPSAMAFLGRFLSKIAPYPAVPGSLKDSIPSLVRKRCWLVADLTPYGDGATYGLGPYKGTKLGVPVWVRGT
jgi:hypothetical protein